MYATDGDDSLGGSDFDMCMYDLIKTRLQVVTEGMVQLETLQESTRGGLIHLIDTTQYTVPPFPFSLSFSLFLTNINAYQLFLLSYIYIN